MVYDPLLCLLERSGKGVRLGELVEDTPAMGKIHPDLRAKLDGTMIFGGAYADDLTLTAPNRADLQALADICNDWFEAHDIEINPAKSVHLSYDPATNRPTLGNPIQLGSSDRRAPVLKLQPLKEPLRVLGMYMVPDGSHDPVLQMCKDLAASQAKTAAEPGHDGQDSAVRGPRGDDASADVQDAGPCVHPPARCTRSSSRSCTPSSTPATSPSHSPARSCTTAWLARCRDSRRSTRRTT